MMAVFMKKYFNRRKHTMKSKRKLLSVVLAFLIVCMSLSMLMGCANKSEGDPVNTGDYEFVFEGGGVFADSVNYHVSITGNKDADQTFVLRVEEMPMLEMTGNWVLVEHKGYKLYFDDSEGSFAYSRYDASTKDFTVKYNLNLGGGQGRAKVVLTYKDEAFSSEYDGEGLPPLPPTFSGHGWLGSNRHDCVLYCYEDGTCVSVTDKAGVPDRKGTYTYDAETNVYSFTFEDESSHYPANYIKTDEEGNTYYDMVYTALVTDDPSKGIYSTWLPTADGFPQFTTGAWYLNEQGEKVEYEFKTTYDEATKTYTLYYEAYSKGLLHRVVTYTVED